MNLSRSAMAAWPPPASIRSRPLTGGSGTLIEVPKVLAGRLPAAGRAGEIAVDQRGAAMMHLQVGSVLTMRAVPEAPPPGVSAAGQGPAVPRLLKERVVGIVVTRGSVFPVNEQDKIPIIMASRALFHQLGVRYARLRPGRTSSCGREPLRRRSASQAQSLTRQFPATGGHVFVADESTQAAAVQRAIRPEAIALALFALVLAVTALLIVGQAATRLLATGSLNNPALAALGMTRWAADGSGADRGRGRRRHRCGGGGRRGGRRVAADADRGGPALAEPDPGVSADATVLAAGAAAIVVLLVARAAWPAWRLAIRGRPPSGTPASAGTVGRG